MILKILFIVSIVCSPGISLAAFLDLPRDSSGWTVFTPSVDSKIVYVSAAGNDSTCVGYLPSNPLIGSDPFAPVGAVLTCATYTAAYSKISDNHPDWILMKRGDVFYEAMGYIQKNGRSATEPLLIGSYGASGLPPLFKTGTAYEAFKLSYKKFIAMSGIEFYAHTRDPGGGEYAETGGGVFGMSVAGSPDEHMEGILIEGCKFSFYVVNSVVGYYNTDGVTVRRCTFLDNYSSEGHSQGLEFNSISGSGIVEENVFDHNGWYSQAGTGGIGLATWFNHNMYLGENTNVVVRDNISLRPSDIGIKLATYGDKPSVSTVIDNNLIVDAEVGISIWGNKDYPKVYKYLAVSNNILTNGGRSKPTNRTLAWGIELADFDSGIVENNLIMNQVDTSLSGFGIRTKGYFEDVNISNNILYNLANTTGLDLYFDTDNPNYAARVSFHDNYIQSPENTEYTVYSIYDPVGRWTFADNKYYSAKVDGQRFRVMGVDKTDAQWAAETGDNSTFEQVTFPDPTRSIETYMQSIGETATIDAFIAKARAQDRYNWNLAYTAPVVNTWLRTGFDMEDPTCVNTPSECTTELLCTGASWYWHSDDVCRAYEEGTDPPAETCSDGILNQDETGTDCGGSCPACGTPIAHNAIRPGLSRFIAAPGGGRFISN